MDLPQRKNMRKYWYDYNNSWSYFITICTKYREHYFGEIKNKQMMLNDLWQHARNCRIDIPNHFPFVQIGEFICMPDHIHGILTINTNNQTNCRDGLSSVRETYAEFVRETYAEFVRETYAKYVHENHPNDDIIFDRTKNISSLQGAVSWSLGSIIRGFKIGVTKFARQNSIPFARQSRFYDHIISDEIEYYFIEQYIKNNPKNR